MATTDRRAQEANEEAMRHVRAGRIPEAIERLRDVIELAPDALFAYNVTATLLLNEGRHEEAEPVARAGLRRIELNPRHEQAAEYKPKLLSALGRVLTERGQYGEAIRLLDQASRLAATAETYVQLGNARLLAGDLDGARKDFNYAVVHSERPHGAYRGLALVYAEQGDQRAALENYRLELRLNPRNHEARVDLAEALLDAGDLDAATRELSHVVERDAGHVRALTRLGEVYARRGWMRAAVEHFERAAALAGTDAALQSSLGHAYLRARKPDEALEHLRRAVGLDPRLHEPHLTLAELLADRGEHLQVADVCRRGLEHHPRDVQLLGMLAQALFELGETEEAEARVRELEEAAPPDHAEARERIGLLLAMNGRWRLAVGHLHGAAMLKIAAGEGKGLGEGMESPPPGTVEEEGFLAELLRLAGRREEEETDFRSRGLFCRMLYTLAAAGSLELLAAFLTNTELKDERVRRAFTGKERRRR